MFPLKWIVKAMCTSCTQQVKRGKDADILALWWDASWRPGILICTFSCEERASGSRSGGGSTDRMEHMERVLQQGAHHVLLEDLSDGRWEQDKDFKM